MVEKAMKVVWVVAAEKGLESNTIKILLHSVTGKRKLSIHVRARIVRYLIPRTTVPVSALFRCLGSMSTLHSSVQLLLFRWMVLVYDLVDNLDDFLSTYDIIFRYLQCDDLRPAASQLLCYMTTRDHVREFRVLRLMELYQRLVVLKGSSESSLMALIALYKLHSPHLVTMAQPLPKKVWFRQCEKALAGDITRIQRKRLAGSQRSNNTSISSIDLFHSRMLAADTPLSKRRKMDQTSPSSVPFLPTYGRADGARVSLTSLVSMADLCQNVHRLELPSQMAGILEFPLLPHVLSLGTECSAAVRLTWWLQTSLSTEFDDYVPGAAESKSLSHLLNCLTKITDYLLELVPNVGTSLSNLLHCWNGVDYAPYIFKLLSYLPLQSFTDLEHKYLDPLKQLIVKKKEHVKKKEWLQFKCSLFSCLTDLLKFWALLEFPRYQKRKVELSSSRKKGRNSRLSVFADSVWNKDSSLDGFNPSDSIILLVKCTEKLLCIAMETENGHALMQHATASFYEVVTRLSENYGIEVLLVPHPQLVNQALLCPDASALSRILQCYISCKTSLSNLEKPRRDRHTIQQFNSVVLDLCDSLWRDLAFVSSPSRCYQTHLFTTDKMWSSQGMWRLPTSGWRTLSLCSLQDLWSAYDWILLRINNGDVKRYERSPAVAQGTELLLHTEQQIQIEKKIGQECIGTFGVFWSYLEACGFTLPVASKLSIIYHPALVGFVKTFLRDVGVEPGRLRRDSELSTIFNNRRLKEQYLDYLHSQHLSGLVNFIRTFIPFRLNKRVSVQPTS